MLWPVFIVSLLKFQSLRFSLHFWLSVMFLYNSDVLYRYMIIIGRKTEDIFILYNSVWRIKAISHPTLHYVIMYRTVINSGKWSHILTCFFIFLLFRWAPGTPWSSGSYRDVHTRMPSLGTFRQLLDAPDTGNIPAAQVTCLRLWVSEGVGSQGQTSQWTYSDQNLEKWEWTVRAFWWQDAVWEWRGTLHHEWHGWYSTGESEVLPTCLLSRQPKGPAAIRRILLLCCEMTLHLDTRKRWSNSPELFPCFFFFSLVSSLPT